MDRYYFPGYFVDIWILKQLVMEAKQMSYEESIDNLVEEETLTLKDKIMRLEQQLEQLNNPTEIEGKPDENLVSQH